MKKIGIILGFTVLLIFSFTSPVFAQLDPEVCNMNSYQDFTANIQCAAPECDGGPGSGSHVGTHRCYAAGATTSEPSFVCNNPEYKYIEYYRGPLTDGRTDCCRDAIAKDDCIPATPVCDRKSILSDDKRVCLQFAVTEWERVATCDNDGDGNPDPNGTEGIQTAIGCVPTGDLPQFLTFVLKFALGAAAGVVVLMLIVTGYQLLTSQGNPEKLAAAKENVVSIISGLILIVFSLVLLQTIGAGILGLPGF